MMSCGQALGLSVFLSMTSATTDTACMGETMSQVGVSLSGSEG